MAKPQGGLTEWFGKGSKGDWVDIGAPKKKVSSNSAVVTTVIQQMLLKMCA